MLETATDRAPRHEPSSSDPARPVDESPVTVEMSGSRLVLVPRPDLDRDDTVVFVQALEAAVLTGAGVLVEFDRSGTVGRHLDAIELDRPDAALCSSQPCAGCTGARSVSMVAAGVIGVAAAGSWWIVDLGRARFARTIAPLDIRFLGDEAWSDLSALWITAGVTRALTPSGSFVTSSCGDAALRAS